MTEHMTKVTEAVYSAGVLRPLEALALAEGQRVRLIVEPLDESPSDRGAALARLKAGISGMQFLSDRRLPNRDELHDRR